MKTRAVAPEADASEAKYAREIKLYVERIDGARAEMRRAKVEIERMKAASKRKLAEIDTILKAC